jgi:hypothetical protein
VRGLSSLSQLLSVIQPDPRKPADASSIDGVLVYAEAPGGSSQAIEIVGCSGSAVGAVLFPHTPIDAPRRLLGAPRALSRRRRELIPRHANRAGYTNRFVSRWRSAGHCMRPSRP